MKNIILISPPAAGKGTISKLLVERDGYIQLSTGNILREMAEQDNELKAYLSSGKLVSDEMICEILKNKLLSIKNKHFILDGFPRTIPQAIKYDEIIKELGIDLGIVIYLDTPKEELIKRITSRLVCSKCGASYSTITESLKSKIENICDVCSSNLIQRTDDNEMTFNERYNTYLDKTSPLLDYYSENGFLVKIDSIKPEETYTKIKEIVG